jgi:hypothetical protein
LAETPEVPNTIMVGNSLSFPMVYNIAPNSWQFTSYGSRKLDWSAETEIWAYYTFRLKSGILHNFAMTSTESLITKLSVNELSFLLVTHMVDSDARFDRYRLLKSGQGAEHFLDRLVKQANGQVSGHKMRETC